MKAGTSPFYPPRAPWYRGWTKAWGSLLQAMRLGRLQWTDEMRLGSLLAGLLLPGHAFFLAGRPAWGQLTLVVWGAAAGVFLVEFGHRTGSIAFGLMIAAHVNSGWLLIRQMEFVQPRPLRSLSLMLALLVYSGGIYWPFLRLLEAHLLVPLRVDDRVIVVNRLARPAVVARGDPLAYAVAEASAHGAWLRAGYGLDRVLALPGDKVRFDGTVFEVEGQSHPLLPGMPASGTWAVPEKHWLIWPRVAIQGRRSPADPEVARLLQETAMVPEKQIIGRPFRHWFWRRQTLP